MRAMVFMNKYKTMHCVASRCNSIMGFPGESRWCPLLEDPKDPHTLQEGDWRHCCVCLKGPVVPSEKVRLDPYRMQAEEVLGGTSGGARTFAPQPDHMLLWSEHRSGAFQVLFRSPALPQQQPDGTTGLNPNTTSLGLPVRTAEKRPGGGLGGQCIMPWSVWEWDLTWTS